ncbi:hypothetical protein ACOME3_001880 [Neoechinorhynchus agilis]
MKMYLLSRIRSIYRHFSTSSVIFFPLDHKRCGLIPLDKRERATAKSGSPHRPGGSYDWLLKTRYHYNVQSPGYVDKKRMRFIYIEEMEPELVVPELSAHDLERLKPYVSYNVDVDGKEPTVQNEPMHPKEIFEHVQAKNVFHAVKERILSKQTK